MPKNKFRIEGDVVWIKLTQGKETCVDLADWPEVQNYRWYAVCNRSHYYAAAWVTGKTVFLHRFLTGGSAKDTDHKDSVGLNNRRYNLRPCTHSQNQSNIGLRRDNTSGFKGVYWHKATGNWQAYITHAGKRLCLGYFSDIREAAAAYNKAANKRHGEFAQLNP